MKKLRCLLLVAVLSLSACSNTPDCTDGKGHAWGQWGDVQHDNMGNLYQVKICEKCHVAVTRNIR